MDISLTELLDGAEQARGLAVVIDVFRAFSVECYLFSYHAKRVLAVGDLNTAYHLKAQYPDAFLVGERNGIPLPGFDCGNSPALLGKLDIAGKTVIHTTSAGTQGIMAASHADEIITGSLVKAQAIASYILQVQPETVSLICMGLRASQRAEEDVLYAHYIQSLLTGRKWSEKYLKCQIEGVKSSSGKRFFDAQTQDIMPEKDFFLCTDANRFPFVIRAVRHSDYCEMERVKLDP